MCKLRRGRLAGHDKLNAAGQLVPMPQSGPGLLIRFGLYEVIEGANSRVTGLYSADRSFVGPIGLG